MKYKNSFKFPYQLMNGSINEVMVYLAIANKSDFKSGISHIKRETIAEITGISKLETISKITGKLEKMGLITKNVHWEDYKRLTWYKVNEITERFSFVKRDIMKLDLKVAAFVCKMSCLRYMNTVTLKTLNAFEKLGMSRPTYYKYLNLALESGILSKDDDIYFLDDTYFPSTVKINEKSRELLNGFLRMDEKTRQYQVARRVIVEGFSGVVNPDAFVFALSQDFKLKQIKKSRNNLDFEL